MLIEVLQLVIVIALLGGIAWVFTRLIPLPAPFGRIVLVVCAIIAVVIAVIFLLRILGIPLSSEPTRLGYMLGL